MWVSVAEIMPCLKGLAPRLSSNFMPSPNADRTKSFGSGRAKSSWFAPAQVIEWKDLEATELVGDRLAPQALGGPLVLIHFDDRLDRVAGSNVCFVERLSVTPPVLEECARSEVGVVGNRKKASQSFPALMQLVYSAFQSCLRRTVRRSNRSVPTERSRP